MNPSRSRGLLVAGAIIALGGIGFYFWTQHKKKQKLTDKSSGGSGSGSSTAKPEDKAATSVPAKKTPASSPQKKSAYPTDKATIMAFQDWMDSHHPNWVAGKNLNKGSGYGTFGPKTKAAWDKFSSQFGSHTPPTYQPNPLATDLQNAISFLASKGFPANVTSNMPGDLVIAWAAASMAGKERFMYNGEYYDTARGLRSTNQTPDANGFGKFPF